MSVLMIPGFRGSSHIPDGRFLSQGPGQSFNCPFGGTIGRDLGGHRPVPVGTQIHNHSPVLREHVGDEMPNDVDCFADIDGQ